MAGIDSFDIQRVEGNQRCDSQDAEASDYRINNCHIAHRVARGKKEHDAQHERKTTQLLQREEKQSGDFRLGRMQKNADDEGLVAEDHEHATNGQR